MNSSQSKMLSRDALYRLSRDYIDQALLVFGKSDINGNYHISGNEDYNYLYKYITDIMSNHREEEDGPYKSTIITISEWLFAACDVEFVEENKSNVFPSIEYVVRKGFEVLHCLTHRDMRRRQLSGTESQIVQEFVALASQYPNPCNPMSKPPRYRSHGRKTS